MAHAIRRDPVPGGPTAIEAQYGTHGHPVVLSHVQATPLLEAHRRGLTATQATLDLGLSLSEVALAEHGVRLPDGRWLPWDAIRRIEHGAPTCFAVLDGRVERIHRFSTALNRPYTLMATQRAPTLINAGFTMHRIVGIDPWEDTARKLRALGAPRGSVLDTATGLGYTAILAAETAARVVTIEIDPLVVEIAALNPWSRALFDRPQIEQRIGDAAALVEHVRDGEFTAILHDPPTVALAGDLYGGVFYRQLYRVLARGGALFHYIGNLESKQGASVAKGVLRRLRDSGFADLRPRPDAFGITAKKP